MTSSPENRGFNGCIVDDKAQVLQRRAASLYPGVRPWHVIQIVRMILDEAVTNAAKLPASISAR